MVIIIIATSIGPETLEQTDQVGSSKPMLPSGLEIIVMFFSQVTELQKTAASFTSSIYLGRRTRKPPQITGIVFASSVEAPQQSASRLVRPQAVRSGIQSLYPGCRNREGFLCVNRFALGLGYDIDRVRVLHSQTTVTAARTWVNRDFKRRGVVHGVA